MDTPDERAEDLLEQALGTLGLDMHEADPAGDRAFSWEEEFGEGTLPRELPKHLNGAKSVAKVVGTGGGLVQIGRAYPLPDGTFVVVVIENLDTGRKVEAWHVDDQYEAHAILGQEVTSWAARIGWKTRATFDGIPGETWTSLHQAAA